jgi:GPH family glycoside/pentoside/hexuronide:cation symporter
MKMFNRHDRSAVVCIPQNERIPLREKLAFSAGTGLDALSVGMITGVLWLPFFNLGLGINAAYLGTVLMIFRLWDAVTDPVMGNISDNARTRWGRRRPFIFIGAITTGLLSMGFWFIPSSLGEIGFLTVLTLLGLVFFTSFTVWSMPYYGLQLEMTPNYDERTRLTGWMTAAGKITLLFGGAVLWAVGSPLFADPETGKADIVRGVRTLAPFFALLSIVFGILPALFVKERYYQAEAAAQPKEKLWTSIRESFHCKPLWLLIGISFFQVLGGIVVGNLGFYVNMFKVSNGNMGDAAYLEFLKRLAMVAAGLALIPVWTWLAEVWDKKIIAGLLLFTAIAGQILSFFCLRPDMPYLQLIPAAFSSGVVAAIWLILPSMKADVADCDELSTGKRREGSINSFYSWFIKAAITGSAGISGVIIQYIAGIDPHLPQQPADVVDRLFAAYLIIPSLIMIFPLYFIWKYPLNRRRMAEIRAELELRRGTLTS